MMTFAELNARYQREQLMGKSSYMELCKLAERFEVWTEHPTRPMIRQWHKQFSHTPSRANKGLGYIRAMYNWAINQELWDDENPAAGIKRHKTFSRERTMTAVEVQVLMMALPLLWPSFKIMLTVLITTGCRLGEACKMKWEDINLQTGSWTKQTTKNGKRQRVPLPQQTCQALSDMPKTEGCPYVFVGQYNHHLSPHAPWKMWKQHRLALHMKDVTLHDFRRTVASRLLEQGELDRVIKAILNHHESDVTSVYARASFDMQARALQQHADRLFKEVSYATSTMALPVSIHDSISVHIH